MIIQLTSAEAELDKIENDLAASPLNFLEVKILPGVKDGPRAFPVSRKKIWDFVYLPTSCKRRFTIVILAFLVTLCSIFPALAAARQWNLYGVVHWAS